MKYIIVVILTASLLTIIIGGMALTNRSQNNNVVSAKLPGQPIVFAASETSLDSPDGKDTLAVKETIGKDLDTYLFTTKSGFFFTKTESKLDTISIPFNSWSPDYKYVFLNETVGGVNNYLVLSVSNKLFTGDSKFLNLTEAFIKKLPNFKLKEVTGWASPTLLVVNTDKESGDQGPSFWYDITTQSFIQLSTRFN
ncbi:hypothetical protein HY045_03835 [Candidatus Woesebacteria bacterium]|nr:hypothetical protein [Candidatus Woesebacteria bacterium]